VGNAIKISFYSPSISTYEFSGELSPQNVHIFWVLQDGLEFLNELPTF